MTSLVTEILSSAGKLENQDLENRIGVLKEKIDAIKCNMQEYVQQRYVDFVPSSIKTSDMFTKLSTYDNEMKLLIYTCENELSRKIDESAGEFQDICSQLASAKSALDVVHHLISIHQSLQESQNLFRNYQFGESVRCLQDAANSIKDLQATWKDQILLLSSLNTEYRVQYEKLKYDMAEMWKDCLKWTVVPQSDVGDSGTNQQIELSLLKSPRISLKSLVGAMKDVDYLQQNLQMFGKRLLQYVIQPIITRNTQLSVIDDEERAVLKLTVSETTLQPPESVFSKLTTVFEFLVNHDFGSVTVPVGDGVDEESLVRRLSVIIYKDFCDVLIHDCLAPAVPSRRQDLDAFDHIINLTTNFHNQLTNLGILQADEKTIISYAREVDSLFTNKMCQSLLANARKLMLAELHLSLQVGGGGGGTETSLSDSSTAQSIKLEPGLEDKHSVNMFAFPKCEISKSAKDLVDMLNNIMEDATLSSYACAAKLVMTIRNILIMYCDIVTCYHKDGLENMPLHSALFHNNCIYIAHHIMILGQKFNGRLPQPLNNDIVTFVDLVPQLREGGEEMFLTQMRILRKNMLNFLSQAGDFRNIATDDKFIPKMERAVKQCMLQLENLSKMWKNILCSAVYCRALGTLLNSVLEEIITQVTTAEDLSADHATQLIQIFEIITTRAPPLFVVNDSQVPTVVVQRGIAKWEKFTEMVLILNSSLQNIVDRWSSGKGPLAQVFSADEIKQMIRALFQNTDRRAAMLAKIK